MATWEGAPKKNFFDGNALSGSIHSTYQLASLQTDQIPTLGQPSIHRIFGVRKKVHGLTKQEEMVKALVEEAEENFFKTLKDIKDTRIRAGKPLHYSVD